MWVIEIVTRLPLIRVRDGLCVAEAFPPVSKFFLGAVNLQGV